MKKTLFFRLCFFLVLIAGFCLVVCKEEPDLPADPHISLVNPFIGVWKNAEAVADEYWQFRANGTGGRAEAGPFPDNFSFFVYAGQDVQTSPSEGSIVILDDSDGTGVKVTRYSFWTADNKMFLSRIPSDGSDSIILERISGSPQTLNLTNRLIGEWSAQWTGNHNEGNSFIWSLKYRADGTVKTYHHGTHQFENAYALRGNTLVIFGLLRFSIEPVIANINDMGNGKLQVIETQTNPAPIEWAYTKVATAEWK